MSVYLTLIEVLAIHEDQIGRYGGASGLRDPGQLEAALFRPQSGYYKDLIAEAAALWESLSQNHPFIDGNKRTAFMATFVFLYTNGVKLMASANDTETFILNLYNTGTFTYDNVEAWLRVNVKPL
ncbi:MAG: type II toxin-antitoxin system death-on-curing family toxin [Alphaproteobacteria bacterium]